MENRDVQYGDLGSLIRLEGVVIGGGGTQAVLMLPGVSPDGIIAAISKGHLPFIAMNLEQWSDWLQRSDNPEILVGPSPTGSGATFPKIFHRKLRYEISGAVQQKIWAADDFACQYCGTKMGKALLTIDHFRPLELGGVNDQTNFLSACKACNKSKGSISPEVWVPKHGMKSVADYEVYLAARKI